MRHPRGFRVWSLGFGVWGLGFRFVILNPALFVKNRHPDPEKSMHVYPSACYEDRSL